MTACIFLRVEDAVMVWIFLRVKDLGAVMTGDGMHISEGGSQML